MPQIPDQYLNSVVILLDKFGQPKATAFVLRSDTEEFEGGQDCYLVTCEHCIETAMQARFANGHVLLVKKDDWFVPQNGDDLAAIDITTLFEEAAGGIGHISITLLVSNAKYRIGAELYMLGLLLDVHDIGENIPRARFGNLSSFANPKVKLEQGNGKKRPCHLADMRSRTGFSGAPVITYVDVATWGGIPKSQSGLLGMHCAQHRERVTLYGNDKWGEAEISSSMTRIVPAQSIYNFLSRDSAVKRARDSRHGSDT